MSASFYLAIDGGKWIGCARVSKLRGDYSSGFWRMITLVPTGTRP